MQEKRFVFGYGSAINMGSLAKDADPKHFVAWATLAGYERIFDAPVDGYLSLNLRPCEGKTVEGVLIEADDETFAALERREKGYRASNITGSMLEAPEGRVFAFMMPNQKHPRLTIPRSYFDLCANALPESMRALWIAETVIENPIEEGK